MDLNFLPGSCRHNPYSFYEVSKMENIAENLSSTNVTVDRSTFDGIIDTGDGVHKESGFPGHNARKLMIFKLITTQMNQARKSFNFNDLRSNAVSYEHSCNKTCCGNSIKKRSQVKPRQGSTEFDEVKTVFRSTCSASTFMSDEDNAVPTSTPFGNIDVSESYASLEDDGSRRESRQLLWMTLDYLLEELGVIRNNTSDDYDDETSPASTTTSSVLKSGPPEPRQRKPWTMSNTQGRNETLNPSSALEEAERLNQELSPPMEGNVRIRVAQNQQRSPDPNPSIFFFFIPIILGVFIPLCFELLRLVPPEMIRDLFCWPWSFLHPFADGNLMKGVVNFLTGAGRPTDNEYRF